MSEYLNNLKKESAEILKDQKVMTDKEKYAIGREMIKECRKALEHPQTELITFEEVQEVFE